LALGLGPTPAGELRFGPAPGTALAKRWSEELRLELDSFEETLGGNPVEVPFDRVEFTTQREFELADEYVRLSAERVEELERAFESSSVTGP